MLPRWHVFWGAVFTLSLFFFSPGMPWYYYALVFFASVFIDVDHYLSAGYATGGWHLRDAFAYYHVQSNCVAQDRKKGIRKGYDFHLFHTLEFHCLIALVGFWWTPAFYLFLGMVFHSLLDIFSLLNEDYMYMREFFLSAWLWKKMSAVQD